MNILVALANEEEEALVQGVFENRHDCECQVVRNTTDARELLRWWTPDVVFVDPQTLLLNGSFSGTRATDVANPQVTADSIVKTGFIRFLQGINPRINLILVSSSDDFMSSAMTLHASGYIHRPLTVDDIRREISALRYKPASPMGYPNAAPMGRVPSGFANRPAVQGEGAEADTSFAKDGLFVRAFGNFEVFYNGDPLKFKHGKTKELLAYLIDRYGSMVSNGELTSALWEDGDPSKHASYLRMMKLDLVQTLAKVGCDNVVVREHGRMACLPANINCDYFAYLGSSQLDASVAARAFNYRGEYMSQYSWSEVTNAYLRSNR